MDIRVLIWTLLSPFYIAYAGDDDNVTAEPGHNVSLPCRAHNNTDIIGVNWTRPDLEQEYVLLYRDGLPDPYKQHRSFKDRAELEDREMKDGDVSMTLKNVTRDDTGTYECRVFLRKTNHRKRATLLTEPISTIYLEVQPDSGLWTGLGVAAALIVGGALILVVVCGLFYRKHRRFPFQSSYKAPPGEEP